MEIIDSSYFDEKLFDIYCAGIYDDYMEADDNIDTLYSEEFDEVQATIDELDRKLINQQDSQVISFSHNNECDENSGTFTYYEEFLCHRHKSGEKMHKKLETDQHEKQE